MVNIYIENNRIVEVSENEIKSVKLNTIQMDMGGKIIIPGFVDTHAHMWPRWGYTNTNLHHMLQI